MTPRRRWYGTVENLTTDGDPVDELRMQRPCASM
jgi:hypothetical protein